MKTLIVYATKHGCAEKCALKLKEKLKGEITLLNLKKTAPEKLEAYSRVIVGGSIYAGKIQKQVRKFCKTNSAVLLKKQLGLFLCHMEVEKAQEEFDAAFPEELRNHAKAQGLFGGEFNLEAMNFIEKLIIKKVAKIEKSISRISDEKIDEFVVQIS